MKSFIFAALIASFSFISIHSQIPEVLGRVFWKGMVDAKIQLIIKGDKIETKTLDGKEYPDGIYSFTTPLPDSAVTVGVNKKKDGRGTVTVTQQPTQDNDFKAVVEITDPKKGVGEYQLEIFWQ
jgi:hypothetical protein